MRSGGGFWQGQGCEQSLEKAVWQGRDPDVVEVNLNLPLFLCVTRVCRSGLGWISILIIGARHCLTCSYLPQTVSGWTRPGHAAAEVGLPVREDQCVGATESTRRSELVFRFLSITSSCLGWTLSLPSQLFHLLPPDTKRANKQNLKAPIARGLSVWPSGWLASLSGWLAGWSA
ncbi:hypothetical protein T12_685 [Trichinella patagoniensis]|uniref:Uncharacterized protein n=1 Tax=Trichinella patagoniensis TaxID=990121 RepID=A0A0V0ZCI5_9BILA|nr:hypothetical protein T12_685 [Trichinella patagoniensis]